MKQLTLILLFFSLNVYAQKSDVFRIDSLPQQGVLLDKGWKFHAGDNSDWAKPEFDDSGWENIHPTKDIMDLPQIRQAELGWIRLKLRVDSNLIKKSLAINLFQNGANEIYLNNEIITQIGNVNKNPNKEITFTSNGRPYSLNFHKTSEQCIAIRFSFTNKNQLNNFAAIGNRFFHATINDMDSSINSYQEKQNIYAILDYGKSGFFLFMGLLYLFFFFYFKLNAANLYVGTWGIIGSLLFIINKNTILPNDFMVLYWQKNIIILCITTIYLSGLNALYSIINLKRGISFWIATLIILLSYPIFLFFYSWGWAYSFIFLNFVLAFEYFRVSYDAIKQGDKRVRFLIFSFYIFFISQSIFILIVFKVILLQKWLGHLTSNIALLSFPIAYAIILAKDFGKVNKQLNEKLIENEKLAAQTIAQEKEKQQILATQNETLERQVEERTAELQDKNRDLEIEAALERVRSQTMAMNNSEEVTTAIATLFTELEKLGVENLRCGIANIFSNKTMGIWSVSHVANFKSARGAGIFDMNAHILWQLLYEGWAKKDNFFYYFLMGQEKEDYIKVLNATPNYLPQAIQLYPDMNFQAYYFDEGAIWTFSLQPHSEHNKELMQRFTSVISLTFRRYQDLKRAEAQVEQAKLDLIQIQTEKKRAENALIELRTTQTQLIQSEKLASLGELTAGIAHEIQNPLNFVNNFSELSVDLAKELNEEIDKDDIDKALVKDLVSDLSSNQEKINHHGKRASNIVKGMLEHSRTSTGVKEPTDINKLVDESLRLSYHAMRAKDKSFNADYTLDLDENLPKINVIPQDIGRVLLNLFNNAFYAVAPQPPKGGLFYNDSKRENYVPLVSVSTHYVPPPLGGSGGACIIKVKDNGNGIPENIRQKIFQPFFTTKPTGEGTGLGLSLSYDIVVKGHGGTLEVGSSDREGKQGGTEMIITIPI